MIRRRATEPLPARRRCPYLCRVPRRAKTLTAQDSRDWAIFAHTVAPLDGRAPLPLPDIVPPPVAAPPPPPPPRAATPRVPAPPATLGVGEAPAGLDGGSWNRLRAGKLAPVRTLDLHGQTAQRAYHALEGFLAAAHGDRVRCVEIITGRGSGDAGGVIRRELPFWLNQPKLRPLVLAAVHPHAANVGAVRLLLRRSR